MGEVCRARGVEGVWRGDRGGSRIAYRLATGDGFPWQVVSSLRSRNGLNMTMRAHSLGLALSTLLVAGPSNGQGRPAADPIIQAGTTVQVSEHVWGIPDQYLPLVPSVGIVVGSTATACGCLNETVPAATSTPGTHRVGADQLASVARFTSISATRCTTGGARTASKPS